MLALLGPSLCLYFSPLSAQSGSSKVAAVAERSSSISWCLPVCSRHSPEERKGCPASPAQHPGCTQHAIQGCPNLPRTAFTGHFFFFLMSKYEAILRSIPLKLGGKGKQLVRMQSVPQNKPGVRREALTLNLHDKELGLEINYII